MNELTRASAVRWSSGLAALDTGAGRQRLLRRAGPALRQRHLRPPKRPARACGRSSRGGVGASM